MTTFLGGAALGTEAIAGTHLWSVITLVVTAPGVQVTTSTVTVEWTYSDSLAYPQAAWRVRLLTPLGVVLDDSSWMTGSDLSHLVDYSLSGNSSYVLELSVRNSDGQEATTTHAFDANGSPATSVVNTDVGKLWDVAINGVGYMLLQDKGDTPPYHQLYSRDTVALDAPRFASSDTPLNGAIERYSFIADSDLSGGAGQIEGDRTSSSPTRFRASIGIDPFTTPGVVSLLPTTTAALVDAYDGVKLAAVGASLYVVTAAHGLSALPTVGGAPTAFVVAAAGTVSGLTTDGAQWYVCDGTGIWRNSAAADPGAAWSTQDAVEICWAGGRICAAVKGAGSSTPNTLVTLVDAGTVEAVQLTLTPGQTITAMTPGGAYLYFAAYAGNVGAIYAWQIGGTEAPRVVWNLPNGESPRGLFWYQGQLMVRASRHGLAVIYRCPTNDSGAITPILLVEPLDPVIDGVSSGFTARGAFVYFGWAGMDGTRSGVGIINLSTGGWCKGAEAIDSGGTTVPACELWQGRLAFAVRGVGIYVESDALVSSGYYTTSVRDGGSALEKVWGEATLQAEPLTNGATVTIEYSVDRGSSFQAVTDGTMTENGTVRKTMALDVKSSNLSWKVTLDGGGARVTMVQSKVHILGLADTLLMLPIDCRDDVRALSGARTSRSVNAGIDLVRSLEALAQTQVVVQDIDWPRTGLVESYEVLKVEVQARFKREARAAVNTLGLTAMVTLRRSLR